jgi:hypothetical protein
MFWFYLDGKKTGIHTRISQGARELDKYLLGSMSRQMKLNRQDFDRFVDCALTKDGYRATLLQGGHVTL